MASKLTVNDPVTAAAPRPGSEDGTRMEIRDWLRTLGDPYALVAVDQEGRVAIDWGVYGAPETFVVDADGIVRGKHVGPLTPEAVASTIAPLVATLRQEATR